MSQPPTQSDSIEKEPVGFRFGLLDVMILITAAAIALWSYDFTLIFDTSQIPDSDIWKAVFQSNFLVTHTLGLTGLLLFVKAVVTRETIFRDPGHWILYSVGFSSAILIAGGLYSELPRRTNFVDLIHLPLPTEQLIGSIEQIMNVMILVGVVALLTYLVAAFRNRGRWRIAFSCLAILVFLNLALASVMRFQFGELARRDLEITSRVLFMTTTINTLNICAAIFIAYCCVTDRQRRSWKHWFGIALLFHSWYATKALNFAAQLLGG